MAKSIGLAKRRENLAVFYKEYKKSSKLSLTFGELLTAFNALFSAKGAYTKILEKAHILKADGTYLALIPLGNEETFQTSLFVSTDFCFPAFYDTNESYSTHNHLGVAVSIGESLRKEYSLLFDGEGKVALATYYVNGRVDICNLETSQGLFLLALLTVISGILREKDTSKARLSLFELVKKNPASTISNIYNYVEKNPKGLENLFSDLNKLDATISGAVAGCMKSTNAEGNGLYQICNHLVVKVGDVIVPYLITEEAKVPALKLDVTSTLISNRAYGKEGFLFPALILFKKQQMVPYFFQQYAFNELLRKATEKSKKGKAPKLERWSLKTKEEKLSELVFAEKLEYQRLCSEWKEAEYQRKTREQGFSSYYHAPVEKNWEFVKKKLARELEANTKAVLAVTDQYLATELSKNLVAEETATLAKAAATITECKKKIDEITCSLGNIYKNEILMANL